MSKDSQIQKLGRLTVGEFFARFPDEEACLNHIMEVRYGLRHTCAACGVNTALSTSSQIAVHSRVPIVGITSTRPPRRYSKTRGRRCKCGSTRSILFVTTRHGVSGKELQRALGVTYKTAWRMGQQIRTLMAKADGFEMLQGHVEVDEAFIGGYRAARRPRQGREQDDCAWHCRTRWPYGCQVRAEPAHGVRSPVHLRKRQSRFGRL